MIIEINERDGSTMYVNINQITYIRGKFITGGLGPTGSEARVFFTGGGEPIIIRDHRNVTEILKKFKEVTEGAEKDGANENNYVGSKSAKDRPKV